MKGAGTAIHLSAKPLILAACRREQGNMPVLRLLVEELGVDINARDIKSNWPHPSDSTIPTEGALHVVACGHAWWHVAEALGYLVDQGADLELRDDLGRTPLLRAIESKDEPFSRRAAKLLVERGADVSAKDSAGHTALAKASGDAEMMQLLVAHGAVVTASALFEAIYKQNIDVVEGLLSAGADVNGMLVPAKESPPGPGNLVPDFDEKELYPVYYAAALSTVMPLAADKPNSAAKLKQCLPIVVALVKGGADPFAKFSKTVPGDEIVEETYVEFMKSVPKDSRVDRRILLKYLKKMMPSQRIGEEVVQAEKTEELTVLHELLQNGDIAALSSSFETSTWNIEIPRVVPYY